MTLLKYNTYNYKLEKYILIFIYDDKKTLNYVRHGSIELFYKLLFLL